jgi:hypothetical protein
MLENGDLESHPFLAFIETSHSLKKVEAYNVPASSIIDGFLSAASSSLSIKAVALLQLTIAEDSLESFLCQMQTLTRFVMDKWTWIEE